MPMRSSTFTMTTNMQLYIRDKVEITYSSDNSAQANLKAQGFALFLLPGSCRATGEAGQKVVLIQSEDPYSY